ncbi:MAG: flagellar protein FlaG [Pseudomonadota bacterium]
MNRIADIASAGASWIPHNGNPYQTRSAANEAAFSDVDATQRARQSEAVDDGGRRDPNAPDQSALIEQSSEQLAKKLNDSLKHQDLEFSVDKDTGSTVITVTSRHTGEVVRQIPSEEVLHLMRDVQYQSVDTMDSARIFDQSA